MAQGASRESEPSLTTVDSVPSAPARPTITAFLLGTMTGTVGWCTSATSIAVPAMITDFGVSLSAGVWIISIYALTMAVGTPLFGRAADTVGVRLPLAAGVGILLAGSVLVTVAPTYPLLLLGRGVQGLGAAAVPVLTIEAIRVLYRGHDRSVALGRWGGSTVLATALGPTVGALATDAWGWRGVALLAAAISIPLAALWRTLPQGALRGRLDLRGATLAVIGATGLVLAVQSPAAGWQAGALGLVMSSAFILLYRRSKRIPDGFLPLSVARTPRVLTAAAGAATVPAVWFGVLSVVPAVLTGQGHAPLTVALVLTPGALVGALLSGLSGRMLAAWGSRRTLLITAVCACLAAVLAGAALAWPAAGTAIPLVVVSMIIVYWISTLAQPAMGAAVAESVPGPVAGIALGFGTFVFSLAGSLGSALAGALGDLNWSRAPLLLVIFPAALTLVSLLSRSRFHEPSRN